MADILSTHLKKAKHTKVICAENAVDNVQGDQSVFSVPTVKSNINIRARTRRLASLYIVTNPSSSIVVKCEFLPSEINS